MARPARENPNRPGPARRPSLNDVASEAGVSIATASRVLSGREGVREAPRSRVIEAAARLGYRTNLAAQAVARGSTNTIALLVDDVRSPASSLIAAGVVRAAAESGLVAIVAGGAQHPDGMLETLRRLRAQRPRAMVIAGLTTFDADVRDEAVSLLEGYEATGGRVCVIEPISELPFAAWHLHESEAARRLGAALATAGYRRPLVVGGPPGDPVAERRGRALLEGFASHGVDADLRPSLGAPLTRDGAFELVSSLPDEDLADSDILCFLDDVAAIGGMAALRERGIAVGSDLAVSGFGDVSGSRDVRPRLTTVRIALEHAGWGAVEVALDVATRRMTEELPEEGAVRLRESTPGIGPSAVRHEEDGAATDDERGAARSPLGGPEVVGASRDDPLFSSFVNAVAATAGRRRFEVGAPPRDSAASRPAGRATWMDRHVEVVGPTMSSHPASEPVRESTIALRFDDGDRRLAAHLHALGHRNMLVLGGGDASTRPTAVDVLQSQHEDVAVEWLEVGPRLEDGFEAAEVVRASGATAVLARNDAVAAGLIAHLRELGIRVPDDVSVVGYGDLLISRVSSPAITSAAVPFRELAERVWAVFEHPDEPVGTGDDTAQFTVRLEIRESTAPAPPTGTRT